MKKLVQLSDRNFSAQLSDLSGNDFASVTEDDYMR
jgi:hypothetical protein